jgi:TonB family protein
MSADFDNYYRTSRSSARFVLGVGLSIFMHLAIIGGLMFGALRSRELPETVVYNVSLVGPIGDVAPEPTPKVEAEPVEEPEPEPTPEPPKPEPPKPEPKPEPPKPKPEPKAAEVKKPDPPKKEEPKPEPPKKKEEPKKEPPKKEEPKKEAKKPAPKEEQKPVTATKMADAMPTPTPGVAGTQVVPPELLGWINRVRKKVESVWVQPGGLSLGMENPTVQVSFWVSRNGTLMMKPEVLKPSSAAALDASGLEAIARAMPLPPLPEAYLRDEAQVIFSFTIKN